MVLIKKFIDSGHRFQIQFDGIFRDANIWLNGIYVSSNKSGYIGAAYDITDFIEFDKENVLVIRADATQYEGWFYEGAGIYRHVWLNEYNNAHIADGGAFVYTNVYNNNADVNIEVPVDNQNLASVDCNVSSVITDRDGKVLGKANKQTVLLNTNEIKIIKQKISLSNPKLWSVDDPYLYRVITTIKSNGKIIERLARLFAILSDRIIKRDECECISHYT